MKTNLTLPPIIRVIAIVALLYTIRWASASHEAVKWQNVTVLVKDTAEFFQHVKPEMK